MTPRSVTIVLLFLSAIVATGVLLALGLVVEPRLGGVGVWLLPAATFATFVVIFFAARRLVLPPAYAAPPWKALAVLSVWMGLTMIAWQAVMWAAQPLLRLTGGRPGTLLVLLGCLLVSVRILDRVGGRAGRRVAP
jgi:hypothetical protein